MDDTEISLRSIFSLLWRQARLIVLTMVAVIGISIFAAYSITQTYTASALVLVDPNDKNILAPQAQAFNSGANSARIDSEVEIMRSDSVMLQVINDLNLTEQLATNVQPSMQTQLLEYLRLSTPRELAPEELLGTALSILRDSIVVQRKNETYIITLSARSTDPEQAAILANAVSEAYISQQVQSKVTNVLQARDSLVARSVEARTTIAASEGRLDDFVEASLDSITDPSGRQSIEAMQRQIDQLATAVQEARRTASGAQSAIDSGDWQSAAVSLQSSILGQIADRRAEIQASLQTEVADSPASVDLRQQLELIETQLRDRSSVEVSSLQTRIVQDQARQVQLRQDVRSAVLASNLPTEVLTELFEIQQSAELARGQYQSILSRIQDLDAQASLQVADSRVVSPANVPLSASAPNRPMIIVVAAIVALLLGVGIAVIVEYSIGGFTSAEQMESVLHVRNSISVPFRKTNDGKNLAGQVVEAPLSIFSETMRRVRATMDRSLRDVNVPKGKVIMVTSTNPFEGKTTIAVSLARTYALSRQSVLLIDCDLRKPGVAAQMSIQSDRGLLQYLEAEEPDEVMISSILARDDISDVAVLVGSNRSRTPTDQLLTSPVFERLLTAARNSYDVIIIDTPPVGHIADALYLSRQADVIAYVVRWSATSQSDVRAGLAALNDAKAPETHVVTLLNQKRESRRAYRRSYGSYSSETA